jgi:hypothetical protein
MLDAQNKSGTRAVAGGERRNGSSNVNGTPPAAACAPLSFCTSTIILSLIFKYIFVIDLFLQNSNFVALMPFFNYLAHKVKSIGRYKMRRFQTAKI